MRAGPRELGEHSVKTSAGGALGGIRFWWQTRPLTGLAVGWLVIAVIGWRLWAALFG